jgi:hypothetical protein
MWRVVATFVGCGATRRASILGLNACEVDIKKRMLIIIGEAHVVVIGEAEKGIVD